MHSAGLKADEEPFRKQYHCIFGWAAQTAYVGAQVAVAALAVGASPGAVLLGADGLTAGGPVNGIEAIEEFVQQIAEQLREDVPV